MGVQTAADVAARKQREGKMIVSYDCTVNGEEVVVRLRETQEGSPIDLTYRHVLSRSVAMSMASELMRCAVLMDVKADRRRHESFMDVVNAHAGASKPEPSAPQPIDRDFSHYNTLVMAEKIREIVDAVNRLQGDITELHARLADAIKRADRITGWGREGK